MQRLIEDGMLLSSARLPVWSIYEHPISAAHFQAPEEFSDFLN